ncbi:Leucine-rich repeat-containing protein ODA7 [Diplonema papillatum]|nr:Leucine-rich repeat-containing protein ODA7 [Diplonema papillatum]
MAEMTLAAVEKCIKEHDGYLQPLLNDQLYLHCRGFIRIDPVISRYTNVKALWLQQNAIGTIENLDALSQLGCLYLHQNCIREISGLDNLSQLHTLNLSQNYITKIEGLGALTQLETLLLSHNRITSIANLKGVLECPALSCLDISNNGLAADKDAGEEPEDVIKILQQLPKIACLYIQGNELPNQTRYFRRKMIGTIQTLTYMDERPVFAEDRRAINQWMIGGFEAEQAERDVIREEKKAAERRNAEKYKQMQEAGRAQKEARELALQAEEAERQAWLAENKEKHEFERQRLASEEAPPREQIYAVEAREAAAFEEQYNASLGAALTAERRRAEAARVREQAVREIEEEDAKREQRRGQYLAAAAADAKEREAELRFLEDEEKLLKSRDDEALRRSLQEIDDLVVAAPAAKSDSPPKAAATAARAPRHVDPFLRPSAHAVDIWEKYSAWERRGKNG